MPHYIKPHYENDCLHWFINVCTGLWTCKLVSISTGISMVSQLWQVHECCNERKHTLLITIIAHETWCLAYCLSTSFLTTQKRVSLVCIVILSNLFFQKTECVQSLINYQFNPLTRTFGTARLCKSCAVKIPLVRFSTMPHVVLSGERKVISQLSIFFFSFLILL